MKLSSSILVACVGLLGVALGARGADSDPAGLESLDVALAVEEAYQSLAEKALPAVLSVNARRGDRGWAISRGSGVLVQPDGIAVTNNHVVADARSIWVEFEDGTRKDARLIGVDPESDLAVLSLDGSRLPYLPLSPDPTPPIGTMVVAIGQPGGLASSVTSGIISATGRAGLSVATFEDFIQTDAAINLGNSGGPLVDLRGRVVGINVAKGTEQGGSVGIGFAIPAHQVRRVVDDILAHGRVRRGWLGVSMRDVSSWGSAQMGLPRTPHVAVREPVPGSPARRSGLREGDVVLEVDGVSVDSSRRLLDLIAAQQPGQTVPLKIWRGGEPLDVDVTLGERPVGDL